MHGDEDASHPFAAQAELKAVERRSGSPKAARITSTRRAWDAADFSYAQAIVGAPRR